MTREESAVDYRGWRLNVVSSLLRPAGVRYWTASVLPALVGTTLPLWLRPPGFEFHWLGGAEFLVATVLAHSGFSFLHARFEHGSTCGWTAAELSAAGVACLVFAGLLGLHLLRFVPQLIFIVYGLAVLFAGFLYIAPPLSFAQRPGGEVVLSMSLGLLPVLGAYLVQTGDLTRKVYVAALPIYAAMLLWTWTDLMSCQQRDREVQRDTLVEAFGRRVSGRVVVPGTAVLLCMTVVAAVLSSSVPPLATISLALVVPMWRVATVSWSAYGDACGMRRARNRALAVHAGLCTVLIASSTWASASP